MHFGSLFLGFTFFFTTLFFQAVSDDLNKGQGKRYSFGVIPALAYDHDLGLKYGGVLNLFDLGQDALSNGYEQFLQLKITNTTNGTFQLQALLESETILDFARVYSELSYFKEKKYDFFGFNGLESIYNPFLVDPGNASFVNSLFYSYRRGFVRLRFDAQHYLSGKSLRFLTGLSVNRFSIPEKSSEIVNNAPSQTGSLLEYYKQWGLIQPSESKGGTISLLALGLVYDTRNDYCYCTDGKWFEATVVISPGFVSSVTFSKFILTYRQHASFWEEKLTVSYRLSSQQKLWGIIPFYFLPTFIDSRLSHDGVGGAFNLRGALRNRIVSDGFLVGNYETKVRMIQFDLLGQEFFASLAVFFDTALISQRFDLELSSIPDPMLAVHFRETRQMPQLTFGPGFYIVFNKKNAITVNYGFSTNHQTGTRGLYVGSSLLF